MAPPKKTPPTGNETTPDNEAFAPKDFLNPKSMLTPGLCGGITMLITNALGSQFGLPPNITGLGISCLFGALVFAATISALWIRVVYWVLNSLVIFSIALGTNQIGVRTATSNESKPTGPAHALPAPPPVIPSTTPTPQSAKIETSKALFSNWLDGTVIKREDLLSRVEKFDDATARRTLEALGKKPELNVSSRKYLGQWVANARTAGELGAFETVLAAKQ